MVFYSLEELTLVQCLSEKQCRSFLWHNVSAEQSLCDVFSTVIFTTQCMTKKQLDATNDQPPPPKM